MKALDFWEEWMSEHPEHKDLIESQLSAIVSGLMEIKNAGYYSVPVLKRNPFSREDAAELLLKLFAKGMLPIDPRPSVLNGPDPGMYCNHKYPIRIDLSDLLPHSGLSGDIMSASLAGVGGE